MPKIKVPKSVKANAKKALINRNKFSDPPMTRSGLTTAKQLSQGFLEPTREKKAFSFLSRTIKAQKINPGKRRKVAINGWGGNEMLSFLKNRRKK
jgi:hypothetical protein